MAGKISSTKKNTGKGRPKSAELDRIQSKLAVTRRQAARLKKSGVDDEKLDTIEAAKLRKLNLECQNLEIRYSILSKEFASVAKMREHFLRVFSALRGELTQWETTLPPQLVGLGEVAMQPKIRGLVDETLNKLADQNWPE